MNMSNAFPGVLSPDLKHALGMTDMAPPPWLINMQRYGPPPSYPSLKLPGLNSPLPPGAHFGYHPGGWGKPPVDTGGMPLYGDVFGVNPEPEDDLDLDVRPATSFRSPLSALCMLLRVGGGWSSPMCVWLACRRCLAYRACERWRRM